MVSATPPLAQASIFTPTMTITPTAKPLPWADASEVMAGLCFEVAQARAGVVTIIRDTGAHIAFYDGADSSALCRRPVERIPFDFTGGRVLAGVWSAGVGCTAAHRVVAVRDEPDVLEIRLRFDVAGTCGYELVRPFWISVDGGRAISIILE